MALALWRPKNSLARRTPSRDLFQAMDTMFDRFLQEWPWSGEGGQGRPAIDMYDEKDDVIVRMDLPGLTDKDVDVTVENGVLTVRGTRKDEREGGGDDYYYAERWAGSFMRSISLPVPVDADRVKAVMKHGILEVRLPKAKEAVGKRIEVKAA